MKMTESFVARWISIGAAIITLLVTANVSMDPVNVPKLLLTSGLGFGMWAIVIVFNIKGIWRDNKQLFLATVIYLALGAVTLFISNAPLSQNFYGVQGRNTGFLAYLGLTGIMLASSQLRSKKSFTQILYALFITHFDVSRPQGNAAALDCTGALAGIRASRLWTVEAIWTLRMQPSYDHSYFFITTFLGELFDHHAQYLL